MSREEEFIGVLDTQNRVTIPKHVRKILKIGYKDMVRVAIRTIPEK